MGFSSSPAFVSTPLAGLGIILGVLCVVLCATMHSRRRAEDAAYKRWRTEMENSVLVAPPEPSAPISPLPLPEPPEEPFTVPVLSTFEAGSDIAHTPCHICLEPLRSSVVTAGRCGHILHAPCMRAWLARDGAQSCPVCRERFVEPHE